MRNKILPILIISTFLLAGCSDKAAKDTAVSSNANNSTAVSANNSQDPKNSETAAEAEQRVEVKTDFNAANPGTVPQLSAQQKTQVNTKLNTSLKNIDNALNSLQEAKDIDLSTVN